MPAYPFQVRRQLEKEMTSIKFALSSDAQARQWVEGKRGVAGLGTEQGKGGLGCSRGVREVLGANKLLIRNG